MVGFYLGGLHSCLHSVGLDKGHQSAETQNRHKRCVLFCSEMLVSYIVAIVFT